MHSRSRVQIKNALREISDVNLQNERWLADGSSKTEMSSFTEAVCGLFDDSGLSTIPEGKPTGFGEEFDLNLYELEKMINKIDTTKGPLHTIRDPLMNEVRSLASKLLLLIDAEGGNQA